MKMFKRIAAVVLAGVMAVGMMTACGNSKSLATKFEDAVVAAVNAKAEKQVVNDASLTASIYDALGHVSETGHLDFVPHSKVPTFGTENDLKDQIVKDFKDAKVGTKQTYEFYFLFDEDNEAYEVTEDDLKDLLAAINGDDSDDADTQAAVTKRTLKYTYNKVGFAARDIHSKTYAGAAVEITVECTKVETVEAPAVG